MTGYFMPNQPDTYHDESSLELQQERNADHAERDERRAESLRDQQQDHDDTNDQP